ncbi:MAG: 5'-nucleotidase [Spirochaetaceae bacterium]|nr:5'-nucleotidase [Spirochaetaceae bacterium]
MAYDLKDKLVIGISSRALFDLEQENILFEKSGIDEYSRYQIDHEDSILKPGTAYPLIEALLKINEKLGEDLVEVIILSKNSPETGLRILNSINEKSLEISRAGFTGGKSIAPYLKAFNVDLFLSKDEKDVQTAIDQSIAAAIIYDPPDNFNSENDEIRIAFDADAVLFSDESEQIYKEKGLDAFIENEKRNAGKPLPEGPFGKLLKTLSLIKDRQPEGTNFVRIAIVTARNSPAHKRVILTLRAWGVHVDEAFFLGGVSKDQILKAYNAHIFFDDQDAHIKSASHIVPSGRVPYKSDSPLKNT